MNPHGVCMTDVSNGIEMTYDEVRSFTLRCAHRLAPANVGVGQKAAVLSYNNALAYATVLSVLRSGATWLPINPRNVATDVANILASFDCDVLFYLGSFSEMIQTFRDQVPSIRHYVCIDRRDGDTPSLAEWIADSPAAPF
ncbi:AMP-binding protein [Actibacterium sp. D379-3]